MKQKTAVNVVALGMLGLLVVHALPVLAKTAEREPVPALSETIDVRVVNLEAVVTEHGVPVHGLSPSDFRLRVNGKDNPIEFFSEIRGSVAISRSDQAGGRAALEIPSLHPGEPVGTSYLVFIDDYFSLAQDRDRVLAALRAQLANLRGEDRMAIVAYDGNSLEMLSSWSQSLPALEKAIEKAEQRPALGLQRWSERRSYEVGNRLPSRLRFRSARFLPSGFTSELSPDEYFYGRLLEDQIEREVMAVAATLRGFGSAPGRRVAILLSGGWAFDIPAYVTNEITRPVVEPGFLSPAELYRPLTETANLLSYTLYPVDLPGMQASALETTGAGLAADFFSARTTSYEREVQLHQTLEQLARETGGKALLNATRDEALVATAADTVSYYWLGFTPERSGDNSQWKVEVEVNRPGLKVRTRRSFTDLSHDREMSMAVESALLFGNPPSPQPLVAHLSPGHKVGMRRIRVPLSIEVPSDAISMMAEGDHYVATLELRVAGLAHDGASFETETIPVTLTAPDRGAAATKLIYNTQLELRPKTEKLVVALYDKASGSILISSLDVSL